MPDENITPDSLPQEGQPSGDGQGAVVDKQPAPVPSDSLSLAEMNAFLGKNFTDIETAKKAIKDTFNYVGKKAEPDEDLLKAKGYLTKEQLDNELFFRDNPDHASNKSILEALAKANNVSIQEAAKMDSYKKLFEGAQEFEKSKSLKSVLNPSPRLQQAIDKGKTVAELKSQGRNSDAATEAARSVIEAFGLE